VHTFESHPPLLEALRPPDRPSTSDVATVDLQTRARRPRIATIDAARGCAMILVCLSHIKHHFVESAPQLHWLLMATTRVATPTFLLLSGFVIGHLLRADVRRSIGLTLVDRGLFLILIAHLLMGLSEVTDHAGFGSWLFARLEITDIIGFALFVAVLARGASPRVLIAGGGAMCLLSWPFAMFWLPETDVGRVLGSLIFHTRTTQNPSIEAPLAAYVGIFLIGMGLSGRFHAELLARSTRAIAAPLFRMAVVAIAIVAIGILVWHNAKGVLPDFMRAPATVDALRGMLDPSWKMPPSPAYLLFYGGMGLLMTSILLGERPAWLVAPIVSIASVIGRASLMCFVVQDLLFFVVPSILGFDGVQWPPFWFAYLAACLLLICWLARQWDAANGNRFLTVGLRNLRRRRESAP
jgi:hypothetical protein